jgi:phthiocerol/phenolphthiocerol synthesis type-I polyketide synthase E
VIEGLVPGGQQRLTLRDAKLALASLDGHVTPPRCALISAQLGRLVASDERLGSAFWSRHLLSDAEPPQSALDALGQSACDVVLGFSAGAAPGRIALLAEPSADRSLLRALGTLYTKGLDLSFEALRPPGPLHKLALPTYPFERERYWLDFPDRARTPSTRPSTAAPPDRLTERPITHPFAAKLRSSRPATSASGFLRKGDEEADEVKGS